MVETTINKRVTTARTEALYVSKTLAIPARLYRVTELHLTQFPVYCYHLDARQNRASDQSQPATRMSFTFWLFCRCQALQIVAPNHAARTIHFLPEAFWIHSTFISNVTTCIIRFMLPLPFDYSFNALSDFAFLGTFANVICYLDHARAFFPVFFRSRFLISVYFASTQGNIRRIIQIGRDCKGPLHFPADSVFQVKSGLHFVFEKC